MNPRVKTAALVLVIVGLGVAGFLALKATKPAPPEKKTEEAQRVVRVIDAQKEDFRVTIQESGNVEPETVLDIVAEVPGRLVHVSDSLRVGYFVSEGELLLEIDPREYRLSIAEAKAAIAQLKAEKAKLEQQRQNIKRNLAVEEKKLELARSELERKHSLLASGSLSQSEVDRQELEYKQVEVSMLNQQNALALLKSEEDLIEAKIEATKAQMEMAEIKLEKTRIYAPFDGRVQAESVEPGSYVQVGQQLAVIYDISSMEIVLNLSPTKLRPLMQGRKEKTDGPNLTDLKKVNQWIRERGAQGTVSYGVGDETIAEWPARVTRLKAGLDETTRTIPVVVEVKEPFKRAEPGVTPPLLPGMFVTVTLQGPLLEDVFKVPRNALHESFVYLVEDGRLATREVDVMFRTRDYAVISKGLEEGDKIVVTPLSIPIPGMKLRIAEEPVPEPPADRP